MLFPMPDLTRFHRDPHARGRPEPSTGDAGGLRHLACSSATRWGPRRSAGARVAWGRWCIKRTPTATSSRRHQLDGWATPFSPGRIPSTARIHDALLFEARLLDEELALLLAGSARSRHA